MHSIKQSHPIAAQRRIPVYLVSSVTGKAVQSITISSGDLQYSKNGANWANAGGSWTEISGSGSGKGGYYYEATSSELDTVGFFELKYEKDGIHQFMYSIQIEPARFASVVTDGGNTSSTFVTDLTESATDYWKDAFATFLSGSLIHQTHRVTGYNGTTKALSFAAGHIFTATPSNGDVILLINR